MAVLTVEKIVRAGVVPSLVAASGGGDEFANNGREFLYVKNDDAAGKDLTFDIQVTVDEQTVTDRQVTVAAGTVRLIGPFPPQVYNDANGRLQITYSAVTSLTIGVLKVQGG